MRKRVLERDRRIPQKGVGFLISLVCGIFGRVTAEADMLVLIGDAGTVIDGSVFFCRGINAWEHKVKVPPW